MAEALNSLRIDRWLYYCRFYKTRSQSSAAVTGGHVRLQMPRTEGRPDKRTRGKLRQFRGR